MSVLSSRLLLVITLVAAALVVREATAAGNSSTKYRGRVVVIRGAFTVFSLGMNELGEKLREYGFDVEVVADINAARAAERIIEDYRRDSDLGPIVFIGHSRGAELGPREARNLAKHRIPVKLIVMVDAVHPTSIPANVERCVNLYQVNGLGVLEGVPARAESKRTRIINADIDRLRSREQGGMINHFNIDSSPWIHQLVVNEVLKVCGGDVTPPRTASARTTKSATPPSTQARAPLRRPTTRDNMTRLRYPSRIADAWSETPSGSPSSNREARRPTPEPSSPSSDTAAPSSEPASPSSDTAAPSRDTASPSSESKTPARLQQPRREPAASTGQPQEQTGSSGSAPSSPRTAARPESSAAKKVPGETSDINKRTKSSSKSDVNTKPSSAAAPATLPEATDTDTEEGTTRSVTDDAASSATNQSESPAPPQKSSTPIQVKVRG
jgi:hypothetical protein